MKKSLSFFFLFILLLSSCSKDDLVNHQLVSADSLKFIASFEENESRTYIEEGNLLRWTEGDQISLFVGNTLNQQYLFDGETGDNSGTFTRINGTFGTGNDLSANYAVYPYSPKVKITEEGIITSILPSEQSYAVNSFGLGANTMVAVTQDTYDTFLKFRNVCGYLKLQLYGDNVTIKSISLTGNNNERLAGQATITPVYGKEPTISMTDFATETVTLDCGEKGVKIGTTASTATAFWLVVPPTTFGSGFTITITDMGGNEFTKSTSNKVVIERNVIKPMSAFEIRTTIPNNQIWYTSSDGNVINPDGIEGIISNTYENGKGVITFESDVTDISFMFYGSTTLTSVTIPSSVTSIGRYAFYNCRSLSSFEIPENVTSIGSYAFYDCRSLNSIKIPDNVTTIGGSAFEDCSSLSCIEIPDNVTALGGSAFSSCDHLTSVKLGNGITSISDMTFYECYALASIDIPDNVTSIGGSAFCRCYGLTSVKTGNGVLSIGNGAFGYCNSLKSISWGNGIKTVEGTAFTGCTTLTSVYVTDLSAWCNIMFYTDTSNPLYNGAKLYLDNNELTELVIPVAIKKIKDFAFVGCTSIRSVSIGNDVTSIGDSAFQGCSALTSITVGAKVTLISWEAFFECSSLSKIYCYASEPPTLNMTLYSFPFNEYGENIPLYVPTGCITKYNSSNWAEFFKTVVEM